MLESFICTDGKTVKIEECLKQCRCPDRNGLRCVDREILLAISNGRRPWKGKLSCTQILECPRATYIKIVYPYAVYPYEMLMMLYGTFFHKGVEREDDDEAMYEIPLENEFITGNADKYEKGIRMLSDYKFCSSFQYAKIASGKQETYIDQLNIYKLMFEEQYGLPVDKIGNALYIRNWDYGKLYRDRVPRNKPVMARIKPKHEVLDFIKLNSEYIYNCLERREMPRVCTPSERNFGDGSGDKRCKSYCSVNTWCPYYTAKYGTDVRKFV